MTNLGYDNDYFAMREPTLKEGYFVENIGLNLKDTEK